MEIWAVTAWGLWPPSRLQTPYPVKVTVSYSPGSSELMKLTQARLVSLKVPSCWLWFVYSKNGASRAGSAAIDVRASVWLLLCGGLLALYLGFTKRRHELSLLGASSIRSGQESSARPWI